MTNPSAPYRLVFGTRPGHAYLETFAPVPAGPGQLAVKSLWSLMSIGTESIMLHQRFEPGTHWHRWMRYPFVCPGYSTVGVVQEVGRDVVGFSVGDRVTCRQGHASHHVTAADRCHLIPEGVSDRDATWFALAKIGWHGARAAQFTLGDTCTIIGAGPVGQMAVRWALAAGCSTIVAVDTSDMRLELARAGGATHTVAKPADQAEEEISAACSGAKPDVVIDTTGNAEVFSQALALVADRGRLVLLGDTGTPSRQHLTFDVILRGITIVGAHDLHEDERWNLGSITGFFLGMVARRRFVLDRLITHVLPARELPAAYELVERERQAIMGMVFDWSSP